MIYSVKQARRLCDYTQIEMAERIGVSRDIYRKIEAHPQTATIQQAYKIAEATGLSIDQIFFSENSTKSRETEEETKLSKEDSAEQ